MKYFGTDGIRGVFGEELTEDLAYRVGAAAGSFFGGLCILGRDTRASGDALQAAFAEGVVSVGCDVLLVGILPTPAISVIVGRFGAAFGAMISASHNPPEYNGIKLFSGGGVKLCADEEEGLERILDLCFNVEGATNIGKQVCRSSGIIDRNLSVLRGRVSVVSDAAEIYMASLVEAGQFMDGVRVWLDCGHGAASGIAGEVFGRLGAHVKSLNDIPLGEKINDGCGALFVDKLRNTMSNDNALMCGELGFAFDGDADRMAAVVRGEVLCGDSVLYSLSRILPLSGEVVVGTVMSNMALERRLLGDGIRFLRTDVGDKNIAEELIRGRFSLGGEQSGHYIFHPARMTGDGILSAIFLTRAHLLGRSERLALVPQRTVSVPAAVSIMRDARLISAVKEAKSKLLRVLVRMSGTEPKLRIMVEDEDETRAVSVLTELCRVVSEINSAKNGELLLEC